MKKKILITGGAGFIGFHLAKHLCQNKDNEIVISDNFFRGKKDGNLKKLLEDNHNIKLIEADLTLVSGVEKLGGNYDQVYHLAAINGTRNFYDIPEKVLRTNVLSTVNILDWFRKNKKEDSKIIFTSSCEAYAGSNNICSNFPIPTPEKVPLSVEDVNNPRWSYGGSKIIGELFFINYAKIYNFRMSIIRPHNIYGYRMGYDHVIPEFFQRISKKENPFNIFGGKETRSFCYIDDMIKGVEKIMETRKTDGEILHIGNNQEEISIENLANKMFKITNFYPRVNIKSAGEGSVLRRCPDLTKIKELIDYQPSVSLEEGLKKDYQWYKENV